MQRRERLSNGQVEVSSGTHADQFEIRVSLSRMPAVTGEPEVAAKFFQPADPAFDYARRRLFRHVVGLIKAELGALPHDFGEDFALDPDTGEYHEECKVDDLLHLLENSGRDHITNLLRLPDVMRIVDEIRAGKDQDYQRRLQKVLRGYSVPRSGAPIKNTDGRSNVATAEQVAFIESQIDAAYAFVEAQRRQSDSARFPENIEAALVTQFKLPQEHATMLVQSWTRRVAAYKIVAVKQGRSVNAVKVAANRGGKQQNVSR
jgi:hypothetical protein